LQGHNQQDQLWSSNVSLGSRCPTPSIGLKCRSLRVEEGNSSFFDGLKMVPIRDETLEVEEKSIYMRQQKVSTFTLPYVKMMYKKPAGFIQ
jgi:hypothetical protein